MRRETADVLRNALEQCIGTRAERAASLDCSAGRLAQMLDASDEATICVARASLLPDPARVALAQLVAGERFGVVELPVAAGSRGAVADCARAARHGTAAVASHLDAISDGAITRGEAAVTRALLREAIASLLTLDAACEVAEREGVIGVPALRAVGR
jgi:hypothetical protein